MITTWCRWVDQHPSLYWFLAVAVSLVLGGWMVAAVWRRDLRPEWMRREWVWAALLLAVIFAWRWPPLLAPEPLNPDEAQVVAGAITLGYDPVFWRSVDGNTSGPMNFYALLPGHWLGLPQDYFNARLTGLLLVWGALWYAYLLLRFDYGPALARLGIMPGLAFFATTTDTDFLQYSTEHLSFFLLMMSSAMLWRAHREGSADQAYRWRWWLAAGVTMGLLPWAKLQAAPLAATLALWGTVLAMTKTSRPWRARVAEVAILAAAAMAPGIVILGLIGLTGGWPHFVNSYIINNLLYIESGGSMLWAIKEFVRISQFTWNMPAFLPIPLLVVGGAGVLLLVRRRRAGPLFLMGALMTAVSVYLVLAPRRGFFHYLLFLVMPLTWWSGAALGELWRMHRWRWSRLVWGAGYVCLSLTLILLVRFRADAPLGLGQMQHIWRDTYDEAGRTLRALRQPGDSLAVWGWNCHLHVQAGLPQATREAVSERQIRESAQRDSYYRPRYLEDMKRNAPAFFVDAVGDGAFGFQDRATEAHEIFPELADYVDTHYVLVKDLQSTRIFVRRDRIKPAL